MPRGKKFALIALLVIATLTVAVWLATIVMRPAYPTPAAISAAAKEQAKLAVGAKAYTARCVYCHNSGFAPSFAGKGYDAGALRSFVRSGPGAMPAFPPSQVSDAELAEIAKYAATLPRSEEKP